MKLQLQGDTSEMTLKYEHRHRITKILEYVALQDSISIPVLADIMFVQSIFS